MLDPAGWHYRARSGFVGISSSAEASGGDWERISGVARLWSIQCGAGSGIVYSCDVCRKSDGADEPRVACASGELCRVLAVEILYGEELERGAAAGRMVLVVVVVAVRGGVAITERVRAGVGVGLRRTSCEGWAIGLGGSGSSLNGSLSIGTLDVQLSQPQLERGAQPTSSKQEPAGFAQHPPPHPPHRLLRVHPCSAPPR